MVGNTNTSTSGNKETQNVSQIPSTISQPLYSLDYDLIKDMKKTKANISMFELLKL